MQLMTAMNKDGTIVPTWWQVGDLSCMFYNVSVYIQNVISLFILYLKHKPILAHSKITISEMSLLAQTIPPSSVHSCSMGLILLLSSLPKINSFSKDPFFVKRKPISLFCYCPFLFPDCPHSLQKFSFLFIRTEGHFRKTIFEHHAY